jgi:hypothetical protein
MRKTFTPIGIYKWLFHFGVGFEWKSGVDTKIMETNFENLYE